MEAEVIPTTQRAVAEVEAEQEMYSELDKMYDNHYVVNQIIRYKWTVLTILEKYAEKIRDNNGN